MSQILRHLERNRQILSPNLSDCIALDQSEGIEWFSYADGSELVADPDRGIYHFLTREGLAVREQINQILKIALRDGEAIGKGRGQLRYASIHRFRDIVAKVANSSQFQDKEKNEIGRGREGRVLAIDDLFSMLEVYRLWEKTV